MSPDHDFVELLITGLPPDRARGNEPWATVMSGPGRVAACVSPSFIGGIFWAAAESGLLFSDNLRHLVDQLRGRLTLDADFIRSFAQVPFDVSGTRTAFRNIHRVEPGTTAIWGGPGAGRPAAVWSAPMRTTPPRTVVWCGPESWAEPHLEGPEAPQRYLDAFDASVDELLGDGPIYAQMSGGLDSTFVVASLIRHATPDNPVHALCHSPHPESGLSTQGRWEPDDYPVAKAMEAAYPGRVVVHRMLTPEDARPLNAAAAASAIRGVPTFNPGNQVWLDHMGQMAAEAGASRLFCGTNGNPAFSYGHTYATGYYLRRGDAPRAWRSLIPGGQRKPTRATVRTGVLSPLAGAMRRRLPPPALDRVNRITGRTKRVDYRSLVGLGHLAPAESVPVPYMDRGNYLHWLAGRGPLRAAGVFSGSPIPVVDPFATQRLLDLAASITPVEWLRGPGGSRTYARLLGAGRVPDSIRLRSRRGGQGWDEWYLIRNDRDRYYDEVQTLAATPILGGWVDDGVLWRTLETWPWGQVSGPDRMSVLAMNRILSLAGFVRAATGWIA